LQCGFIQVILPVVKIDLRTASNRKNHYKLGSDSNASINDFNNFARVYEDRKTE
jgi:hypothetical protein